VAKVLVLEESGHKLAGRSIPSLFGMGLNGESGADSDIGEVHEPVYG
jgi:hypothetical protein